MAPKHKEFEGNQSCDNSTDITIEEVRNRTQCTVEDAFESGESVLIEAPPGAGKTSAIPMIVNELGMPTTYLTARKDLYWQMEEMCEDIGLEVKILSSPHRECPTFQGAHGDQRSEEVERLYRRGYLATRLHADRDLPCNPCPYVEEWDFEAKDYDVIIGHYKHAYVDDVVNGRIVVVDEFPGNAYVTHIRNPEDIITNYVGRTSAISYASYRDIVQNRGGPDEAMELLAYTNATLDRRPDLVDTCGHAQAPLLTLALIAMKNLGNGFESTTKYVKYQHPSSGTINRRVAEQSAAPPLLTDRVVVRDQEAEEMWILSPPDLADANAVIGLDGTPTRLLWEIVTGERFRYEPVLSTDELNEYVKNVQELTIKQTANGRKPYHSGNYVTLDHDAALLLGIDIRETESAIISTQTALDIYDANGLLDYVDEAINFGNTRSNNIFKGKRVGIVSGAPHPGDQIFQRWGAFMGYSVPSPGQHQPKDYGSVGNRLYRHFVHKEVFQAMLRFGRDGNGATVYLNTTAIPGWLDIDAELDVSRFKGEKRRRIVEFLREHDGEDITQKRIQEECDVSRRTTGKTLRLMEEGEYVERYDHAGWNGVHLYVWNP